MDDELLNNVAISVMQTAQPAKRKNKEMVWFDGTAKHKSIILTMLAISEVLELWQFYSFISK